MANLIIFLVVIAMLSIIKQSAAEETNRSARQRQRILHYRYPQVFRYKPDLEADEPLRRGSYRPTYYKPAHTFELPDETRQSWVLQNKMPHNRRPGDANGAPPANWPLRPSMGREQPSPHDMYGAPLDMPDTWDDDVRNRGFRNEYDYEEYTGDEFQGMPEKKGQLQNSAIQKSEQYMGAEMRKKMPTEDKIENFEIPLELLRAPSGS